MGTALLIVLFLSAAVFGVWVLTRMTFLIRDLMKVTTGLTGLGAQIGRITEATRDTAPGVHFDSN